MQYRGCEAGANQLPIFWLGPIIIHPKGSKPRQQCICMRVYLQSVTIMGKSWHRDIKGGRKEKKKYDDVGDPLQQVSNGDTFSR